MSEHDERRGDVISQWIENLLEPPSENYAESDARSRGCSICAKPGEDGGWFFRTNINGRLNWRCDECEAAVRDKVHPVLRETRSGKADREIGQSVGTRYVGATLADLTFTDSVSEKLGEMNGDSACLLGPNGTGKTHVAAAIFRNAIMDGRDAYFCIATELVDDLRGAVENNDVRGVVDKYRKADLLIIDDLAMERPTEFVLEQLTRLIDWRYRDGRQTIFTTNLSGKDLRERYGPRLWSRIVGLVGKRFIKLGGEDHRQKELRS